MTVRALAAVALITLLAGCGTASDPSPPSGVDQLVVPTPSPDPDDFVAGVDNPWFPLPSGREWSYDVIDTDGSHRIRVTVAPGPEVAGVATTARIARERGTETTDWFAQDEAGNVWWFGRAGQWRAGADGAEAGLAMPDRPRTGDGFRTAYAPGVVEDVVTVLALDGNVTVPAGSYDDLLVTRVVSVLEPGISRTESWARGIGLVEQTQPGRTVRLLATTD